MWTRWAGPHTVGAAAEALALLAVASATAAGTASKRQIPIRLNFTSALPRLAAEWLTTTQI